MASEAAKAARDCVSCIDDGQVLPLALKYSTHRIQKAIDASWRSLAADWLESVADVADAEGLTMPEIIEDRKVLAELLRKEAKP